MPPRLMSFLWLPEPPAPRMRLKPSFRNATALISPSACRATSALIGHSRGQAIDVKTC